MNNTSGGKLHMPKAVSLIQFTRNERSVSPTNYLSPRQKQETLVKMSNFFGEASEKHKTCECAEENRTSKKERLKLALQKHSQLKKRYNNLVKGKQEDVSGQGDDIQKQNIKELAYNQINEQQYAHKPLNQETASPLLSSSEWPSFISIFNGVCIQQFQVLRFFSQGVSGRVFLAQHLRTHWLYSVKVIRRSSLTTTNFKQLVREVKIQSFLNHPNIVRLYHIFVDKESVYLFLQPCLDGDLFRSPKKKEGRLVEREARQTVKQICQAVEYLHRNDIIHRDIKPQNILMHQGVAKLCDFGWAVYSPLLRDTRCGTPLYVSPEMVKSELYDSKIDLWNIGILTYQLLFGAIPFELRQLDDLKKILQDEVYFPTEIEISGEGKDFISKCLHKNSIKRLSIRQAIEHDFLRGDRFKNSLI